MPRDSYQQGDCEKLFLWETLRDVITLIRTWRWDTYLLFQGSGLKTNRQPNQSNHQPSSPCPLTTSPSALSVVHCRMERSCEQDKQCCSTPPHFQSHPTHQTGKEHLCPSENGDVSVFAFLGDGDESFHRVFTEEKLHRHTCSGI